MTLVEFLINYFSEDDRLNKFNNSEITTMFYRYRRIKSCIEIDKVIWFPYDSTDMEIANVLKSLISVPFTFCTGRENNKIWSIVVTRVFIPS